MKDSKSFDNMENLENGLCTPVVRVRSASNVRSQADLCNIEYTIEGIYLC